MNDPLSVGLTILFSYKKKNRKIPYEFICDDQFEMNDSDLPIKFVNDIHPRSTMS